jgi:hypothetical protein
MDVLEIVVRFLAKANVFYLFQDIWTGSVAHLAFYAIGTGCLSLEYSGWVVKLTADLRIIPGIRMSGAISLPSLTLLWRTLECLPLS